MKEIFLEEKEIQNRIKICQKNIESNNLSGMVLTTESNVTYFTGYRTHAPWTTFTRPIWLFIPKEGNSVLFVQTFVVPEAKAKSYCCDVKCFDSLKGPSIDQIKAIMKSLNMIEGNIGWELGYEQRIGIQVDTFLELRKSLSKANFVDASDILWSQRIIKSPYEISCHQKACEATSYAHDKIFNEVHAGMSELEITRRVQQLMLEGGAEYPGFVIIASGEGNYEQISGISSNRTLLDGDMLWLDLGATYQGYWSDFCRAGIVGEISQEQNDMQDLVHEVTMKAISELAPGVPVAHIARICANELINKGFDASFECGRMGHGMGLLSTEPSSVTPFDKTILEEGMIINLEPGIVTNTGVYDIEENMVITKDGYQILSGGSRKLHKISK